MNMLLKAYGGGKENGGGNYILRVRKSVRLHGFLVGVVKKLTEYEERATQEN